MKLSKAIIKKYGISKKAWAVARGSRKPHKRNEGKMAKRRKNRTYARKTHRVSHKRGFMGGFGGAGKLLGAALYGGVREQASNALSPLTSKLPLGSISDEVGMIVTLWAGKKFLGRKMPLVNDFANAGILIESARIGAAVASGQVSMGALSAGGNAGGMQLIG